MKTLAGLALFATAAAYCQDVSRPQFEVASIKTGGDEFSTRPNITNERFTWTTQIQYLIGYAYGLDFSRVTGVPKTLAPVYVVEATFAPLSKDADIRLMMRSLLEDRFKLRSHRVVTETEGYALSVAKGGLKSGLKKTDPANAAQSFVAATGPDKTGANTLTARNASIAQLVETLARNIRMPVWDKTGLSEKYDFEFPYARDVNAESAAPWLGTALQQTLGLTFDKQKGPQETLVVDSMEPPSEN